MLQCDGGGILSKTPRFRAGIVARDCCWVGGGRDLDEREINMSDEIVLSDEALNDLVAESPLVRVGEGIGRLVSIGYLAQEVISRREALRWRKYPDEKPELKQRCLIRFLANGKYSHQFIAVFCADGTWGSWRTPTEWRPLPEGGE
jgi:hypothetical protein